MKKLITTAALFLALAFNVKANDLPRKEYPRPQFEREDWINLNGTWTFDFDFGQSGVDRQLQNSEKFSKNIIVPFCPESELSGVKHTDFINCMWYQRKFPYQLTGTERNIPEFRCRRFTGAKYTLTERKFSNTGEEAHLLQ